MKKIFAALFASFLFSLCMNKAVNTDAEGNIVPCVRQNVTFEFDGSMFISVLVAGGILLFIHNLVGHWIEHHGRRYLTGMKPGEEGAK